MKLTISILIDIYSKEELKKVCISDGVSYLTQETVEKILDKYPDFFDNVNLQIADKDIYSGFSIKAHTYEAMPTDIKVTFTCVEDISEFSFNLEASCKTE